METKLIPKRIDNNEKIVFYKLRNNKYIVSMINNKLEINLA